MPTIKVPPRTGELTATVGNGTYALTGALLVNGEGEALFTFSEAHGFGWITDGDLLYLACKNASGGHEELIGTYNHGAQTIARTTILKSTNGGGAVSWGSGDKALFASYPSSQILLSANNLSELASPTTARTNLGATSVGAALFIAANEAAGRTALALGTAAVLNTGTASGNIPVLGSQGLPAVSGELLTGLPQNTLAGQSGGTDGKVVRLTSANTWVDAANTDTQTQLCGLCFKQGGLYYPPGSLITGLSSLTAGVNYWLSTAGSITATPPTPSGSVRSVYIGKALSTTSLFFIPMLPITG